MRKSLAGLYKLPRLASVSHLRAAAGPQYTLLSAYAPTNLIAWIRNMGAYWLHPKHKPMSYSSPDTGIYTIDNQTTMSLAGDWASGTDEAALVAEKIAKFAPDYTIHLGDTYYIGSAKEMDENFLGIKASEYLPVSWPRGKKGTFALLGNHDMFSNGDGYFDVLLRTLGQKASYFILQNDYWQIVGLDTGYNSAGLDIWPFKPSCKLYDEQIDWLYANLKPDDKRGLILLSHHQPWSSFETPYPKPYRQLSRLLVPRSKVYWFWGHEHRLAIYKPYAGIFGRCIGHGGMPIELREPHDFDCECVFTDMRSYPNNENLDVGFNGFANLNFYNDYFTVTYLDLNNTAVYRETS